MKIFRYQKWFFDVCTSTGEYFILFISCITVFGKDKIYLQAYGTGDLIFQAELELLEISGYSIVTRQGNITFNESQIALSIVADKFAVSAIWTRSCLPQYQLNPYFLEKRSGVLKWKPVFIKAAVYGYVKVNDINKFTFMDDNGYIDKVESTFLPFIMPVKHLFWGRLHSNEIDITFTYIIESKTHQISSKTYVLFNGNAIEFDSANLVILDQKKYRDNSLTYPEKYKIEAVNSDYQLTMQVNDHNITVVSDFINDVKQYGVMATKFFAIISKNPKGIKSLAKAHIKLSGSSSDFTFNDLILVDEYVCFNN